MGQTEPFTSDERREWANRPLTRAFVRELERRENDYFRGMENFTQPETVTRDYFQLKGFCEGMQEVINYINELKKET